MEESEEIEGSLSKEFEGCRRPGESHGDWLQRLLFEPFEKFDAERVQEAIKYDEVQRMSNRAALEQEFYQACLELEAWSSARGPQLHETLVRDFEDKMATAQDESRRQVSLAERVRQHLVRFAEMVGGALNMLNGALDIFDPEQNLLTVEDSVPQIPSSPVMSLAPVDVASNGEDPGNVQSTA